MAALRGNCCALEIGGVTAADANADACRGALPRVSARGVRCGARGRSAELATAVSSAAAGAPKRSRSALAELAGLRPEVVTVAFSSRSALDGVRGERLLSPLPPLPERSCDFPTRGAAFCGSRE